MTWQFTPYPIALIFVSFAVLLLTRFVWLRRARPGGLWLLGFLFSTFVWSLAVAFELASVEVWADVFWSKVSYLGAVTAPVFFFFFAIDYCRLTYLLSPRSRLTFWIIPLLTVLLVFSNEWHRLVWTDFSLSEKNLVVYWYGPWFWVNAAYQYVLVVISAAVILITMLRLPGVYRGQLLLLLTAAFFPLVGSLLYVFKLLPTQGFDPSPLLFSISGLVLAWSILRYRMLDLVPIALSQVFDRMSDGVIVLDEAGRIVDINPAARHLFDWVIKPEIGMRVDRLLLPYPDLHSRYSDQNQVHDEMKVSSSPPRYLELRIDPLYDEQGGFAGRLMILSDITERKLREEQLHHSEMELDALLDALTSDVIFVMDREGHYLKIIPTNPKLLYRPIPDLLGKSFLDVLPSPVGEKSMAYIRRALETGRTLNFEYPLQIGGMPLWFDATISPITDQTVFWVAHDITHHKRMEEAEARARQRAQILNEIIQSISGRMPFERLLEQVDQQIGRVLKDDTMLIASYRPGDEEYHVAYVREGGETVLNGASHRIKDTVTGYVIEQRETLLLNNSGEVVDFLVRTGRHFRKLTPLSMIAAPLVVSDQVLGALAIFNFDEENCYSQDDFILFKSIAAQVSIAFETAHLIAELEQLALTDSLTGLYNRRHFFNLSSREFERAMRHETSLAAVMIDLDHFKRVNDTHGHAAGDQVLRAIARLCMERLRRIDIIGRYGGEEFAVVMPDTDLNDAIQAAARLGEMIAAEKIMLPQGELRVTASLGVALFERDMPNLETLLDHADQAMYAAKKAGRNRVEVYASPIADEENNLD